MFVVLPYDVRPLEGRAIRAVRGSNGSEGKAG